MREEGAGGALYHMRARYYDALTARFIIRDPVWLEIDDPALINPYQYARGNPLRYADFTGLSLTQEEEELGALISAINRYSQRLQENLFSREEQERMTLEDMTLIQAQNTLNWQEAVAKMTSDPAAKEQAWEAYRKQAQQYQERKEQLSKERERINQLVRDTRQGRREELERMKQRFKELWLKKVGGKEAFLGKRRLLVKVIKEAGKAGPKLQVFYQNVGQILFSQVEPLFFEFLEDLGDFEGDQEAMDIIGALAWQIQFGR